MSFSEFVYENLRDGFSAVRVKDQTVVWLSMPDHPYDLAFWEFPHDMSETIQVWEHRSEREWKTFTVDLLNLADYIFDVGPKLSDL